ncbi:MAG: hypothetical protein FJZ92_08575 [Chloroflexi bacterium]|nr:hypothetical protein [Chloroflexota bacterium]
MAKPEQVSDVELRALLESAHEMMRKGKSSEAVRTLSTAYLKLLALKPDLLDRTIEPLPGRKMPAVMRWPMLGANLTLESVLAKQPEIQFIRERFSVSEAITYYEYTLECAIAANA